MRVSDDFPLCPNSPIFQPQTHRHSTLDTLDSQHNYSHQEGFPFAIQNMLAHLCSSFFYSENLKQCFTLVFDNCSRFKTDLNKGYNS